MNNLYKLLFCVMVGLFLSCEHDSFEDEDVLAQLTEGNTFVRFDNAEDEVYEVMEGSDPIVVKLEYVFPISEDVTVNYDFGGTAVFGTDFMIEGATSNGGSVILPYIGDNDIPTEGSLAIQFPTDGTLDGDKTLIINLVSASTSSGITVDPGQGDLEKTRTFNIAEADCAVPDLTGSYDYTISGDLGDGDGMVTIEALDDGYVISDFANGAFGEPVPYEFTVASDGSISAPAMSALNNVSAGITGQVATCTGTITMNVQFDNQGTILNWTLNLTPQ